MNIKKNNFIVGDWVIMNESYKENLKNKFGVNAKIFIMNFDYPQEIQSSEKEILGFLENKRMWNKAFRLATEKEIKEYKLKNIFFIGDNR